MLRKLIKHEFRATGRLMLPVMALLLVISAVNRVTMPLLDSPGSTFLNLMGSIVLMFYSLSFMALGVVTLIVLVERFRKNVLGNEGYLTNTLPVTADEIIWSKLIVNFVWGVAVFIVVAVSIMINVMDARTLLIKPYQIERICELLRQIGVGNLLMYGFEFMLEGILIFCVSCLMFYASFTFGHMFRKHRTAKSVLIFALLMALLMVIGTFLIIGIDDLWEILMKVKWMSEVESHLFMWAGIIPTALIGACLYLATSLGLKKNLNLE